MTKNERTNALIEKLRKTGGTIHHIEENLRLVARDLVEIQAELKSMQRNRKTTKEE